MDIVCQKCQSRFKVPDEKIPADRKVSLPCPKCRQQISIAPRKDGQQQLQEAFSSSNYDASEKPFDFIEEEGQTALVCESDATALKKIVSTLNLLEYHVTVSDSGRDALKKMRYHQYDLVVVNESFFCDGPDANMVLLYLERLNMSTRRNIYVVMISSKYRTMDQMMAFRHSVNMIVNTKNIDDIGKIIQRGLTDNDFFYRVFKESLKEVGKS
ncbi:MAG TPA: zinc-ribbon domain-containing protein [Desulfobacterales bacterium]